VGQEVGRACALCDRPFGDTDYIHGGHTHWYIYHRGDRWEPQFNVGMFGAPPGRQYLRIGVGFSLTLNSRDPDRQARLEGLYSLFCGFQSSIRGAGRQAFEDALGQPLIAEVDRVIQLWEPLWRQTWSA
jgi:hypothetical protein